jgi:hypothetical protein
MKGRLFRGLLGGVAWGGSVWLLACGVAQAATTAEIKPELRPATPNSRTTVYYTARFSNTNGGLPAPLKSATVFLPEGLTNERLSWPRTLGCGKATLLRKGPNGCPPRSLVGSGTALLGVETSGAVEKVPAKLFVFVGPTNGAYVLEVLGETATQPVRRFVFTEQLSALSSPYSSGLETTFEPIVVAPALPPASIIEYSLAVGEPATAAKTAARHKRPRRATAHRRRKQNRHRRGKHKGKRRPVKHKGHRVRVAGLRGELEMFTPPHCPAGGYHWLAQFTFTDGSHQEIATTTSCP